MKTLRKCPRAYPTRTSEGLCLFASTLAHPVPTAVAVIPISANSLVPGDNESDLRFLLARVVNTATVEAWPDGKLL